MRLSELVNLNDTDIDNQGNVTIRGKGSKERRIVFNSACLDAIEEYRLFKEKFFEGKSYDHHAIFIGRSGKRLTTRWIEQIIKKRIIDAGFGGRELTPHKLRHTAATVMYRRGVDIRALKEILGHESLGTTQIYTHVSDEQIREAMTESPLQRDMAIVEKSHDFCVEYIFFKSALSAYFKKRKSAVSGIQQLRQKIKSCGTE